MRNTAKLDFECLNIKKRKLIIKFMYTSAGYRHSHLDRRGNGNNLYLKTMF